MYEREREFDLLADAVRQNLPGARKQFDLLVRPLVRVIVERDLRREMRRNGHALPEPELMALVDTGVPLFYHAILDSILRSPGAETVSDLSRFADDPDAEE